ncbi:MAG: formate dehydrogenase subunit delta [Candidatus Sphingomonas colombiensis]|nr:formate dehydrogenase subunit delta [Sphingomonas sp.]WEK43815.1 MAG: formate dehydrogenase subunit delta [Sphingomonas sp.]
MTGMMSTTDRLLHMANQIARAFASNGEDSAIAATCEHLRLYWDPLMRGRIVACLDTCPDALSDIARGAVERLRNEAA